MADLKVYTVEIDGKQYDLEGDHPPSEAEARSAIGSHQSVDPTAAATAAWKPPPTLADEFTPRKIGERALSGLKGEAEGVMGGLTAPVAALGYFGLHPIDATKGAAAGIAGAGALGLRAIQHPSDAYQSAKDMLTRIGSDPESIGQVAGSTIAAIATPTLIKAAKGTRIGQAVEAGVSDAANKIPGVKAARDAYAASAPASATSAASAPAIDPIDAELRARGLDPSRIKSVSQGAAQGAPNLKTVPLRPIAAEAAPAVAPVPNRADLPLSSIESPLKPARVDIGAEKVGRAEGLTKQQVRDQVGPILGEAQGEASPILPQKALQRIVDDMQALPKEGGAREAYVAKATSGKAQWQIENIRRTLEHLGLVAPLAAVAGRQALLKSVQDQ